MALYMPDVIRVDISTPPVRLAGQSGFRRFGFAGGDTTTDGSERVKSSGWPNGRRLGDDVAAHDQVYHQVFPYSATPHAGPTKHKDPCPPP